MSESCGHALRQDTARTLQRIRQDNASQVTTIKGISIKHAKEGFNIVWRDSIIDEGLTFEDSPAKVSIGSRSGIYT